MSAHLNSTTVVHVYRYDALLRPSPGILQRGQFIRNAALIVQNGKLAFVGAADKVPEAFRKLVKKCPVQPGFAIPTSSNAHTHLFQPRWSREGLIYLQGSELKGSLLPTLRSESAVKKWPERTEEIVQEFCDSMIDNGIGEAVIYTTSSMPALKEALKGFCARGFEGRVKLGYVFMDQNLDRYHGKKIQGVHLEVKKTELSGVFDELRILHEKFPGMLTAIDRFPIAVSSALRKKIVAFCQETGMDYDTHVDESEGEAALTSTLYKGARIISILESDGVFSLRGEGQTVRLAHGLFTNKEDFKILKKNVRLGCAIEIVACPSSNFNIKSTWKRGLYKNFPFVDWKEVARVRLGIDSGAGLSCSLFQEAQLLIMRDSSGRISWQDAFNAFRSSGSTLSTGAAADWLHVYPDQVALLKQLNIEELIKATFVGAAGQGGIQALFLNGKRVKSRARSARSRMD